MNQSSNPSTKQANDLPPPPNPRSVPPHRAPPAFPLAVPVLPGNNGSLPAGYNNYMPQQYNQMRHAGKSLLSSFKM